MVITTIYYIIMLFAYTLFKKTYPSSKFLPDPVQTDETAIR